MKIHCQVTPLGLVPLDDADHEARQRLHNGDIVLCDIRKPRNPRFHRKFFALLRLTYDNLPDTIARALDIHNPDDLLIHIKLALDHYDIHHISGTPIVRVRSIDFDSMDETNFHNFYARALDHIVHHLLPGTTHTLLQEEIDHQFRG